MPFNKVVRYFKLIVRLYLSYMVLGYSFAVETGLVPFSAWHLVEEVYYFKSSNEFNLWAF